MISHKIKASLAFLLITVSARLFSFEKLNDRYQVSYGTLEAKTKVVQYFSFMCPFCLELYRREFETIKLKYIESDTIAYTFHPVPKDLLTVCAMDCLEKLNPIQKIAFLEVMLEEIDLEDIDYSIGLMKQAMEILGVPVKKLNEKGYLQDTKAFKDAFLFLSQEETISGVPAIELDGKLYPKDVPDLSFLEKKLKGKT
jgi:Thioredoxin